MLDKLTLNPDITYFSLPYFTFLCKCVKIRQEVDLMGNPDLEIKIRNLPIGYDPFLNEVYN